MKKIAAILAFSALTLSLSGCALLYPNWGTTQSPGTSESADPSASASASASASESAPTKGIAKVQIDQANVDATAGVIDVVAQVTNFNEDGGQCTLTIQAGTQTKKVSVKAESNVTSTQCYPMELSLSGLPKGTALVTVSYDSAAHAGTSADQSVVIP
jgi:hypothetical protein